MGNSGSSQKGPSSSSASSASATSSTVVCYYELLGIELTATPEEIKKAYRSKALQLHPDKNMHRVQEATEMFSKIQNAYQVLYDPQERAFYDRHRESILRKGKGSRVAESGYSVDDLMNFFDPSVFKGYGDDPKGFYAVYRDLFSFLEDLESEESETPTRYDFTSFGSRNIPFEPSLKLFYDKFIHFSSIRTFYEADNYDDNYAENRRHRRAIGKENQKLRDAMRREYNDTVRNLAAWVRKRDPRWQTYQKERTSQRVQAEARRKEENVRRRAEMAENYIAPDWANVNGKCLDEEEFLLQQLERLQFEALGSETNEDQKAEPLESVEDSDNDFDDFYCVLCKKVFKNHKQWKNHEQSKKHRANMSKAGFNPESDEDEELVFEVVDSEQEYEGNFEDINTNDMADSSEENDDSSHQEREASTINVVLENILLKAPETDDEIGKQKPPKKKNRQRKPAEISVKPATTKSTKTKPKKETTTSTDLKCSVCHEAFDSRNKLFKHIEVTGHAALKGKKK